MAKGAYEKILKNAYKLFSTKGYDGTSMNELARRAGVSKGNLYHHFENKEDLIIRVLEEIVVKESFEEFKNLSEMTKENFKDVLISKGLKYIKAIKKDKYRKKFNLQLMPLLTRMSRKEDIMGQFKPFMEMVFAIVYQIIELGINFEIFAPDIDKELIAQKIFMTLDAIEMYVAFELEFRLEDLWRDFIENLCGNGENHA